MSALAAQISALGAAAWAPEAAAFVPVALAFWAAWELRGAWPAPRADERAWRVGLGFGGAVLALHAVLAGAVLCAAAGMGPEGDPNRWKSVNLVFSSAVFQSVAGWMLLTALLARSSAAPRRRCEALPWLLPGAARGRQRPWAAVGESGAWLAAAVGASAAWLALAQRLAGAQAGAAVKERLYLPNGQLSYSSATAALGLIVLAPLFEEVAFRGFLLERLRGWLGRRAGWARAGADGAAVALTAAVWALAHAGQIEPIWVKWVQIFLLGLALGVLRLRRGLEACVAVHLLYNFPGGMLM